MGGGDPQWASGRIGSPRGLSRSDKLRSDNSPGDLSLERPQGDRRVPVPLRPVPGDQVNATDKGSGAQDAPPASASGETAPPQTAARRAEESSGHPWLRARKPRWQASAPDRKKLASAVPGLQGTRRPNSTATISPCWESLMRSLLGRHAAAQLTSLAGPDAAHSGAPRMARYLRREGYDACGDGNRATRRILRRAGPR